MADSKVMIHEITSITNADDHSTHSVPSSSTITPPIYVLYQDNIKIPSGLVLKYQRVCVCGIADSYHPAVNVHTHHLTSHCVFQVVKELNICTNCWKPISENQSTINTVKKYAYVESNPTLIVKL